MTYHLRDHVENGLVIFCGAGVSMVPPTCLPSWWQMNEQVVLTLAGLVERFIGPEQAASIARQINERRDHRRFPPEFQAEIISKHFGDSYFKVLECLDGDEPNAVHLALACLAKSGYVRAIVTSNFDRLLETAFRQLAVPLEIHYQSAHFEKLAKAYETSPHIQPTCQLLKLHGSVDDHTTLVDTLAQRMRGLSPAICACLRHLLHNHHWLFLGYSGADLEANPGYLCLQSEADSAKGISWLLRKSANHEPNQAVIHTLKLYGDRANMPRGELPDWLFDQFGPLLVDLPIPAPLGKETLELREKEAAQAITRHTREWGETVGGVRAARVLADILRQSVGNPQAARYLLNRLLEAEADDDAAYVAVANSLASLLNEFGELEQAAELAQKALIRVSPDQNLHRIGLLNTLGLILYSRGDYQPALDHFEQAYEISATSNDDDLRSIALHNRAMALTSLGRYNEALSCYQEALEIVRVLGDVVAQAQTLNNIGDLLRQQDQYEEALRALNQSMDLRERLGDVSGVARCLGNIATIHQRRGEYSQAREIFIKVLETFRRLEDQSGIVTTLCNLGSIAQDMDERGEAEQAYREAAQIAADHMLETGQARALASLGFLYTETGRLDEAGQPLEEARRIYRTANDPAGEAGVLDKMGIRFWRAGQLDQAEESLKQAISTYERLNQQIERGQALGNLAIVFQQKGDLDQALALLQEEFAIVNRLRSKDRIANTLYNIGAVQARQNKIDEALASLDNAQHVYQEIGVGGRAARILGLMGEIHGRHGKIGESLKRFDQSIPLAASVEDRAEISQRLVNILRMLLENNYREIADHFIQRLNALGAEVRIETGNNPDLNPDT